MENSKRLRLGVIFNYSPNWMGGIFYVINIVKTLNYLDDKDKPVIILFFKPELSVYLEEFNYPYIHFIEHVFPSIIKGNIFSIFRRRNLFFNTIVDEYKLEVIYPVDDYPLRLRGNVKPVAWYTDLQHKYYPEFFTKLQRFGRHVRTKLLLKNCDDMIISSNDTLNDFKKFYKIRNGMNMHVYHFVSLIDDIEDIPIANLKAKYNLPDNYFLVSNQFHKHKNHKVVLLALANLKSKGIIKHVAFTGKFPNAEDSPYLSELHRIIQDNSLQEHVIMLGLISRKDQLLLMKHAQAVIQPSLFEGWSTVIEDAKSLQSPVIASSLKVNIEQLQEGADYFDAEDSQELASIMADYPERNLGDIFYQEYSFRVQAAAETLISVFKS